MDERRRLIDAVALWECGLATNEHVIDAAVDCVVAGLDHHAIVELAGVTRREADDVLPDRLPTLMAGVGLPCWNAEDDRTQLIACAAIVRSAGNDPEAQRAACDVVHRRFGHMCHRRIDAFSRLDDEFDTLDFTNRPDPGRLHRRFEREVTEIEAIVGEFVP